MPEEKDIQNRYEEAFHLLYTLNGGPDCNLSNTISCNVCPFNLGGPCVFKSILFSVECHKGSIAPASYPRNCMEEIAKGVASDAWSGISEACRARIKGVINILHRQEGKPGVP